MKINIQQNHMKSEVLVTGTFNIMHAGHVELFAFANQFGKVTVGINNDNYLLEKYGSDAVPLLHRIKVLESCKYVNNVVFFNEDNPGELIKKLKPTFYIKGPDYRNIQLPEQDALDICKTKTIIFPGTKISSSSKIIEISKLLEKRIIQT